MNKINIKDPSIPYRLPQTGTERLTRFLSSPAPIKFLLLRRRLHLGQKVAPVQLGFGAWWLPEESAIDGAVLEGHFEMAEVRFVHKFLKSGARVLDIGAHHGFYTLLAAELVGSTGRVISFEPSPRERRRLQGHIRLNRFGNVTVRSEALGEEVGEAELFLVDGREDWCNSLRPPSTDFPVHGIKVPITTLDKFLQAGDGHPIDFIKLDVEGGELGVLKGASRLLTGDSRPTLLVEIEDARTKPWGYPSRNIIEYLSAKNYDWYSLTDAGLLAPLPENVGAYYGNFVAWPRERTSSAKSLLA